MPEDQKSGFSEAVETGASAAHTIRGAIKTGKAISSAAKGAAAGGPYCLQRGRLGMEGQRNEKAPALTGHERLHLPFSGGTGVFICPAIGGNGKETV